MKPVCLLTGAAGELGNALCNRLCTEYNVIATYHVAEPAVVSQNRWPIASDRATPALGNGNCGVFSVQADLNRREDIRRLVEVAMARYGQIDAIVNSAGDVETHGKLLELWHDDDYAQIQLQTNCISPMQLVSAVHYHCWKDDTEQNRGMNRSVLNVSCISGVSMRPAIGTAFRAASYAALNMLTLHVASELAPYSVRANAVCFDRHAGPVRGRVVEAVISLLCGSETGVLQSVTGRELGTP
jgi:NAD(P)-dependent dehydrogenase (short-subunit alcohol dehydrogenase family)